MKFLFFALFLSYVLTEMTICATAQLNSPDTNQQNFSVANDAPPPPFSSVSKRFIGIINVSTECYIGVLTNGCIYLCGNNPDITEETHTKYNALAGTWQRFGLTIIDYSGKANVWINLKNNFNFNDFDEMHTCDVFYETHIKGISSFGMTQNVITNQYNSFDYAISGDGFIKYGSVPASREWGCECGYKWC